MPRRYDHVDLRVPRLAEVASFYETLLPALGFTRNARVEGWLQFEAAEGEVTEFFGVTESIGHVANENRIAFWASSINEVDRLTEVARQAGARNIEGPMPYEPDGGLASRKNNLGPTSDNLIASRGSTCHDNSDGLR